MNTMSRAITPFLLVGTVHAPLIAQVVDTTQILQHKDMCTDCISLTFKVRLGDEQNGFITEENSTAIMMADGAFVVLGRNGPPPVFDENGRFRRLVGRRGGGPGEFRSPLSVTLMADDSLAVFDRSLGRVSVFSPTLEFVRSFQINGRVYGGVHLADGTVILNANIATREQAGLPLHTVSLADGHIVKSFGAIGSSTFNARSPGGSMWRPTTTDGQHVWIGRRTRYTLESWGASGALRTVLERRVSWFEPYAGQEPLDRSRPPRPFVQAIHIDDRNHLWVIARVGAPDWDEHLQDIPSLGQLRYQPESFDGVWDTRIEIIQLPQGTVLASQHFPEYVAGFAHNHELIVYGGGELPTGEPIVHIWTLAATGLPNEEGGVR